jgi:hypothetical protein
MARLSGRLNFNTQFPYLMRVRPDHEGDTSGRLKSNRQLPCTMHQRPNHSCQMSGRFILNYNSCLTEIRVRTVDWSSLSWNFGKNQWSVRELIGVRTCCWNVRTEQVCTEASRYDVGVRTEEALRPDRWCLSVWCPNGVTRHPDGWNSRQMGVRTGWQGTLKFFLLHSEKWNPCLPHHLHISDFVQIQNKAKILT